MDPSNSSGVNPKIDGRKASIFVFVWVRAYHHFRRKLKLAGTFNQQNGFETLIHRVFSLTKVVDIEAVSLIRKAWAYQTKKQVLVSREIGPGPPERKISD